MQFHRHEGLVERAAEVEVSLDAALVGADAIGEQPGVGDVDLRALDPTVREGCCSTLGDAGSGRASRSTRRIKKR
jgi:hypothetical protein